MKLTIALIAILIANVIFGYWRSNTKKLSLQWIMAIHIPVPIAIGLRFLLLGWSWPLIPAFVADFAAGQYVGGRIRNQMLKREKTCLSSWLIGDIIRVFHQLQKD